MLVGVGGSGKQSLTRLAAFIAGHTQFQITISKNYNENALFDDFRSLYITTGQKNLQTTFLVTDLEIKNEGFLEYFNAFLSTGEISGLFAKDEMDGTHSLLEVFCGQCFLRILYNVCNANGTLLNSVHIVAFSAMVAERRADFLKERPHLEENLVNMYNFFVDRVRDNLHIVLCFSPLSSKFAGWHAAVLLGAPVASVSYPSRLDMIR